MTKSENGDQKWAVKVGPKLYARNPHKTFHERAHNKTHKQKMFLNRKTVFIGKFNGGYTHGKLKEIFKKHGGSCVGNVSKNIDFIIVPNNPRDSIKENQQIKRAQKDGIPILKCSYIFDSLNNGRMLSYNGHKLMDLNVMSNVRFQTTENQVKRYQIFTHPSGKKFHWDLDSGYTNWGIPSNPNEKISFIPTDEGVQKEIESLYFNVDEEDYIEDPIDLNMDNNYCNLLVMEF